MDIVRIIKDQHDRLIMKDSKPQKYRILKDYQSTYIERQLQEEEKMIHPIFRVFQPVKPESGRKLNVDLEHVFDPYTDSLMDYPSIIGYKLNRKWNLFNRLICIHLPLCPNDCWHCYVPKELYENAECRSALLTAQEIVDKFLDQQSADKSQGKHSNVLRITGGEPFLLPKLILECLQYLREKGHENKVFLWTETNLEPFIGEEGRAFMDHGENLEILRQLSSFRNLAVHPCFHGLNEEEFKVITGKDYRVTLDQQVNGLKRLVDASIDVFPTFGSNVCDPSNIKEFFDKLREVHSNLPLRVALVEYKVDYEPVPKRLEEENRKPKLHSRFANLRIWNKLLLKQYGIGYAMIPRHFVSVAKEAPTLSTVEEAEINQESVTPGEEILYLFKSSYRDHYHREILETLALPISHVYRIEYDKTWVQEDVYFHMAHVSEAYVGRKIIWCYVNIKDETLLPFREASIEEVETSDSVLSIKFKLGKYLCWPDPKEEKLTDFTTSSLKSNFGRRNIPPGGKYILLGEDSIFYSSSDERDPWITDDPEALHHITPHLLSCDRMKRSLFYRVTTENLTQKAKSKTDSSTVYEIKGGKSFKIKLDYYLPNYSEFNERYPEERTIYFQSSSETITPLGEPKVVFSKYGSEELEFITEKVSKRQIITITFWSKYDEFRAAKVILYIHVLPNRMKDAILSATGAGLFAIATSGLAMASQTISKDKSVWTAFLISFKRLFTGLSTGILILNILYIVAIGVLFFLLFYLFPSGIPFKIKG